MPAAALWAAMGPLPAQEEEAGEEPGPSYGGKLWSRPNLTGDWWGARGWLAERGVTFELDATYTFQGVAEGGLEGPLFHAFSDEGDTGHTFASDLAVEVDTAKVGLWRGGFFNTRIEGRAGESVLERAGTVSAVNNDALFPNDLDRFDQEVVAFTELSFTQYLLEEVAVFGGLLNNAEGDENEFADSAVSRSSFLNSALLYALVEDATVPNVSLGGGVLYEPGERLSGSFAVFATEESAGEDPFEHAEGVTFATEWTIGHELGSRPGAQVLGFLYGIDASRTNIAADPRLVLGSVLLGQPVPETTDETWAFYYNAHQYLWGESGRGGGLFLRFGVSDGNPNPVKLHLAGGLGGKGPFPGREGDRWGLGVFYLEMSDEDLLEGLDVDREVGGELFYSFAVTPWLQVTLDAQVIDSALPSSDTAWVLGIRTRLVL